MRDGTVVYDGEIDTLRRFNDDVREVAAGYECGIVLHNFQDIKEGDVLEVYETRAGRARARVGGRHVTAAYVALLLIDLHFPDAGSLKAKRKELAPVKAQLHTRLGAAVAEVDHQDLWQRSTLAATLVQRLAADARRRRGPHRALAGRPVSGGCAGGAKSAPRSRRTWRG